MLLLHQKCLSGGTQAQTTDVESNQRFIVVGARAVRNNRRWTGKDGFQGARQADEHTGWKAGRYGDGDPGERTTQRFNT